MEVKRVPPDCWCAACDNAIAEIEISKKGNFHLFWANNPTDREITLCPNCFNKLKKLINEIEI